MQCAEAVALQNFPASIFEPETLTFDFVVFGGKFYWKDGFEIRQDGSTASDGLRAFFAHGT